MTSEIGKRILTALGIDPKRNVKRLLIDLRGGLPRVTTEEVPEEQAVKGLVAVLDDYVLVPKGKHDGRDPDRDGGGSVARPAGGQQP